MTDTGAVGKIAVNIITELFKTGLQGLKEAEEWIESKNKEYDPFGRAAKKYAMKLDIMYNFVRVFGMNQPVPLRTLYTRINILDKITSRQRSTIEELQKIFAYEGDLSSYGRKMETTDGIDVVNQNSKIIVLGKPGAGKTTFLKYITLQALDGALKKKAIPIFVSLKDWSDSRQSLMDFIVSQFSICNFPNARLFIERILSHGKCILLLDGFDEVTNDIDQAIIDIKNFSDKYDENQFVLSCRIAAYNYSFNRFVDVEIADFDDKQIKAFVSNWFRRDSIKTKLCWEKIKKNRPIRELARIPLLLTLLCLAFDETMDFPPNRAELYKEALDALLKRWDSSRSIKRAEIYKHLSVRRKESLFSHIAATTFDDDRYFLPQSVLEKYIIQYLEHLPRANEEPGVPDGENILKAIEAQHGIFVERAYRIYSFSHLTFQEYYTARYIVENSSSGTLSGLVDSHLFDRKWREVFLLTAGMLDKADSLLINIQKRIKDLSKKELSRYFKEILVIIKSSNHRVTSAKVGLAVLFTVLESPEIPSSTKEHMKQIMDAINGNVGQDKSSHDSSVMTDLLKSPRKTKGLMLYNRYEIDSLEKYIWASRLLIDCLNAESYVTNEVRQSIYDSIFLISQEPQQHARK